MQSPPTPLAQRYQYQAIEFKQTAQRSDGVFEPDGPGLPVYFVEVQFYDSATVMQILGAKRSRG